MSEVPQATDGVCAVCGEVEETSCMLPRRMRKSCDLTIRRLAAAREEFIVHAFTDPETLADFHRATGRVVSTLRQEHAGPGTSRERLANVNAFVEWVTKNRWEPANGR